MNRKIYEKIAKKHGVTVKEVKHNIRVAVDETYKNPAFHAQCVDRKGDIPTPEEFITHIARRVRAVLPQDDVHIKNRVMR